MASCPLHPHPSLLLIPSTVSLTRDKCFGGAGPVNRFWFDGTSSNPCATTTELWDQVYKTIRTVSPWTMITAYRGDVCAAKDGQTLYTNDGPPPNSTDPSGKPMSLCRTLVLSSSYCSGCAILSTSTDLLPACRCTHPCVHACIPSFVNLNALGRMSASEPGRQG